MEELLKKRQQEEMQWFKKESCDDDNIYYVGFWHPRKECAQENAMPWDAGLRAWYQTPVENSVICDQSEIIEKLQIVETIAQRREYRGGSPCRLCERPNGGSEFFIDGFVWPSGYMHYLCDHNVKCDEKFAEYLLAFNPNLSHITKSDYHY